jgi:hypothetical protein
MSLLREIGEDFGDLRGTGWDEQEMKDRLAELAAVAYLCALTTFAALAVAGPVTAPDLAGSVRSALPQGLQAEVASM